MILDLSPIAVEIAGRGISWYSVLFVVGLLAGYVSTERFFVAAGLGGHFNAFFAYGLLSPLIGGRIVHFVFYEPGRLLERPQILVEAWAVPGLASHGALAGLLIGFWLFSRRHPVPFLWLLDRGVASLLLIGGFIRIGNFLRSEQVGTAADLPWAVVFRWVDEVPRHPVQLYEAAFYLMLHVGLVLVWKRGRNDPRPGLLSGLGLTAGAIGRIVLEGYKDDPWAGDSVAGQFTGQMLSIPFLAAGILLLFYCFRFGPGRAGERGR